MIRILVNASVYDGRPSGLGQYARALLTHLAAQHPDLVVLTSHPQDLPGGRGIRPWGEPSRGRVGHLLRLVWSQSALPTWCRRTRAGVLLNTLPEGPLLPPVPQVTVVHDVLPLFFPEAFPRQRWYFRAFVPRVLRASRHVVAVSAQTRDDLLRVYGLPPDRVTVIPSGVDHRRFTPLLDPRPALLRWGLRRYFLFVGNLFPHKNLFRLLEAFRAVPGDIQLVLAGHRDPRYLPALERHVELLGVGGRVRFLGYVADAELPALYAGAVALVLPSLYEGFGLPALEAMACGTPVIASTAGGLREAVGDAAVTVDPHDVDGMARAMERMTEDAALQADLRTRGQAHARRFQWQETARRTLGVLRSAAGAS